MEICSCFAGLGLRLRSLLPLLPLLLLLPLGSTARALVVVDERDGFRTVTFSLFTESEDFRALLSLLGLGIEARCLAGSCRRRPASCMGGGGVDVIVRLFLRARNVLEKRE